MKPKKAAWLLDQFRQLPGLTPPAQRKRRLIVTGFTRFGFWAKAKVYQWDYFPTFTWQLARNDTDCVFVWDEDELDRAADHDNVAILHLFNEEKQMIYTSRIAEAERRCQVVFNSIRSASIVRDKKLTNMYLSTQGVPMPELVAAGQTGGKVFSNAVSGSGRRVTLVEQPEDLATDRYNTAYIDTRIPFDGKTFHTMFRIQAVGRQVQLAYVRARNVKEGSPSVHSADTPAKAALLNHLHEVLVAPRLDEIHAFTNHLGGLLGPGFFAHDMVVCARTGRMMMVESGFKLNDSPYAEYLETTRHAVPNNAPFYDGTYPVLGANLLSREWDHALSHPQADPSRVLVPGQGLSGQGIS